jgi:hypothetical protein
MLFTSDIDINKNYPAVLYDATEPLATYFEDREVNGVMYRVQNATYGTGTTPWSLKLSSAPAFAIVQNPDGSTSNFTMPAGSSPWAVWEGDGQRGIFDVRDFGATGTGLLDDSSAIQNAANAAHANGGGVVYLPAGTYLIQFAILLYDNTTLYGDGYAFTTLLAGNVMNSNATTIMVANQGWSTGGTAIVNTNIYIKDISFNCNGANNSVGQHGPIFLKLVANCGVMDCEIYNSSTHGILVTGIGNPASWPGTALTCSPELCRG